MKADSVAKAPAHLDPRTVVSADDEGFALGVDTPPGLILISVQPEPVSHLGIPTANRVSPAHHPSISPYNLHSLTRQKYIARSKGREYDAASQPASYCSSNYPTIHPKST
ncbi:hypothetical protein Cob_v011448 [Colletotrichum orbiculare MAFF 240422]|uniref:Uncharacterized protein n=1 Tax=Colletotrichum orbiculare (strain 104-T / ATCC 96160 / CBS 514.97 / LARS 414 / MAFF 240422) TaxID=1213857 RepID=A0A484FCR9_COLOR|nr:hypothetical protein Cob_v011448 [Colletotrichum orbiculare MAFF 240422]